MDKAGAEFLRRILLQVLPPGVKRIRHYGVLAPSHKGVHLAAARVTRDVALGVHFVNPASMQ